MAGKVESIYNRYHEQEPTIDLKLSDLLIRHQDTTFGDLEIWFNSLYKKYPGSRHEVACHISDEIQTALYALARKGYVELSNNLRIGLNRFKENEKVQKLPTRLLEYEYFTDKHVVEPGDILENIPDLTIDEIFEEARRIHPDGNDPRFNKTELFTEWQKGYAESFLRKAIINESARPHAIKLGKELGIWTEEH